jgi:hypothetical protein
MCNKVHSGHKLAFSDLKLQCLIRASCQSAINFVMCGKNQLAAGKLPNCQLRLDYISTAQAAAF